MTIEESLRVTDISNGEQLLFANASLLQVSELSPLNALTTSTLTTHTVSTLGLGRGQTRIALFVNFFLDK